MIVPSDYLDEERFKTTLNAALQLTKASADKHDLYGVTSRFLLATFYLFADSPHKAEEFFQFHKNIMDLYKIADVIKEGLPVIIKTLFADLNNDAKIYRSAIQFLSDKINSKFTQLLSSDIIEELNEDIELWNNPDTLSEYPMQHSKINLENVPVSHTWWSEEDRKNNK